MTDDMTEAAYYSNSTGITSLRWPPAAAFARQLRLDCSSNSTRGCFYPGCRRGVKPGNSVGVRISCVSGDSRPERRSPAGGDDGQILRFRKEGERLARSS